MWSENRARTMKKKKKLNGGFCQRLNQCFWRMNLYASDMTKDTAMGEECGKLWFWSAWLCGY